MLLVDIIPVTLGADGHLHQVIVAKHAHHRTIDAASASRRLLLLPLLLQMHAQYFLPPRHNSPLFCYILVSFLFFLLAHSPSLFLLPSQFCISHQSTYTLFPFLPLLPHPSPHLPPFSFSVKKKEKEKRELFPSPSLSPTFSIPFFIFSFQVLLSPTLIHFLILHSLSSFPLYFPLFHVFFDSFLRPFFLSCLLCFPLSAHLICILPLSFAPPVISSAIHSVYIVPPSVLPLSLRPSFSPDSPFSILSIVLLCFLSFPTLYNSV